LFVLTDAFDNPFIGMIFAQQMVKIHDLKI